MTVGSGKNLAGTQFIFHSLDPRKKRLNIKLNVGETVVCVFFFSPEGIFSLSRTSNSKYVPPPGQGTKKAVGICLQ